MGGGASLDISVEAGRRWSKPMIGLLSNENLHRNINWSTLSDSLYREIEAISSSCRIAPPRFSRGTIRHYWIEWRKASKVQALFAMHGSSRAEWPLMTLSALRGPVKRASFFVDPWPYTLKRISAVNKLWGIDTAFIPYREAFERLVETTGRTRYVYLPFAADTHVFREHSLKRDIDLLWMGRRHAPLHEAILAYTEREGLTYLFRERTGFIADPFELGRLASRSRYFVVTPPDLNEEGGRSGGFSPLLMRYLEGLAAGCRLLGVLPRSGEFEAILPVDSLLEVAADGKDFDIRFNEDQAHDSGWDAVRLATEVVRREHGWDARAKVISVELGEMVSPKSED